MSLPPALKLLRVEQTATGQHLEEFFGRDRYGHRLTLFR
jgi:hypothetical protein